jgi:hypothetical protein
MGSSLKVKTVNKEIYAEIIRRLRDAVRTKNTEKLEIRVGFSFTTMLQDTGRVYSRMF